MAINVSTFQIKSAFYKVCLTVIILLFKLQFGWSQVAPNLANFKTKDELLVAWDLYCNSLKGTPTSKENYPQLIIAGKEGLRITPKSNNYYKSLFAFYTGKGFESTFQMDSAIHYYELSENYALTVHNNSRIVFALRRLVGLYHNKGLYKKSSDSRDKLKNIALVDKDPEIQMGVNIVLGEYYFANSQYEKALKNYLDYIKYLKKEYAITNSSPSRSNIGVGLASIGEIYQKIDRPNESLSYLREAIVYLDNYQEGLETVYKDLLTSFCSLNKIDSAKTYYQRLKPSVLNSGDYTILIDAQVELGNFYIKNNEIKEATKYLREAEGLMALSKEKEDFYRVQIALGDLMLKKDEPTKAIEYYNIALPIAINFKSKEELSKLYYNLSAAEAKVNHPGLAYKHLLKYSLYQDSLRAEAISKNMAEMEARFQNETSKQKVGLLSQENSIKNLEIKSNRRTRLMLLIGIVVAVLFAGLFFNNYRNKQKANTLLDKQNIELDQLNGKLSTANDTKSKLFGIISHDLRGPVSKLFSFLELQKANPAFLTEDKKAEHQQKLIGTASHLLETMEDLLLWSKSQMQKFEVYLEEVEVNTLFQETIKLLNTQAALHNVNIQISSLDFNTVYTDINFLGIILRNVLQNAIKHSPENSKVFLSAFEEGQNYIISVVNSGSFLSEEQIDTLLNNSKINSGSSGLGLFIAKEMANEIQAKLSITSSEKLGTDVRIILPQVKN